MNDNIKPTENRTLFNINVSDISPNPFNPRLIFNPDDLNELKKSIAKVNILVPVTVYRNTKSHPKTPYILLDGERRWRCAQELNMETIPANIIDEPSDDTQNILYMFNIHHFRKEWALFPTALKLETVIEKIGTDQESILADFTGVSRSMIRRCKTLLWYPKKYRDVLMEKGGKISTDFFIELFPIAHKLSSIPEFQFPEGTENLVDKMIVKFLEQKTFYDVKEFREIRKSLGYFEKSGQLGEFADKVKEFIDNNQKGLEVFVTPEIEEDRTRNNVIKYVSYLNSTLKDINSDLISDYSYVIQLQLLQKTLKELLEEID
jgi:ParB family transcriptional regulator, chromosome partitioning protein